MKKIILAAALFLQAIAPLFGQADINCQDQINKLIRKITEEKTSISRKGKIDNNNIAKLYDWFQEITAIRKNDSWKIFEKGGDPGTGCQIEFTDICNNFQESGQRYLFLPDRFAGIGDCTNGYADEWNTGDGIGRLKKLALVFMATYSSAGAGTLKGTEKNSYSAFHEFLYYDRNPKDVAIYSFFYSHLEDIKKATGFDVNPGITDKTQYAQDFILSFKPHLKYYFGMAEEEYVKSDANNEIAHLREPGVPLSRFREDLRLEFTTALTLIEEELRQMKEKCTYNPVSGQLTKNISYFTLPQKQDKMPVRPTREEDRLKPGNSWVLIKIVNVTGLLHKEYGGYPHVGLYKPTASGSEFLSYIYSSTYAQVPQGNYIAQVSISAYPRKPITVSGDYEVTLRLGRLYIDPKNWDGSDSKILTDILAIVEKNANGSELSSSTVKGDLKSGEFVDLAPGRYIVKSKYGITESDTIIIRGGQCTRLSISGHAKFKAPKENIVLKKLLPGSNRIDKNWAKLIGKEEEIQLPPGTDEVKPEKPGQKAYRVTLLSNRGYIYGSTEPVE